MLARLTPDLGVWRALAARFEIDLFCGWFLERPNGGVTISPETLTALGRRGIELGLDIYGPAGDERAKARPSRHDRVHRAGGWAPRGWTASARSRRGWTATSSSGRASDVTCRARVRHGHRGLRVGRGGRGAGRVVERSERFRG